MRKLLKSRKGVALEMALLLIVVTFALSTLILTVALLQHKQQIQAKAELQESIVLEQIGEDFCRSVINATGDDWKDAYPDDYWIEIDGLVLTVTKRATDKRLLTVELAPIPDGDGYTIVNWEK